MDEQSSLEREIQDLRSAAERGVWNSCRDAAEALLLRLAAAHAVRLTHDFVARRLPVFERQQPGLSWPRELLAVLAGERSSNEGRKWPEEDEFPGPGANSFKKAVESLWRASLSMSDTKQRTVELVDAISGAIMSERVEHWGSRHPKEWALWYQLAVAGDGDPRTTDILLAMKNDPDVQRLQRAAWLEVTDTLEAVLRESALS
jgi:hypothetical protein